MKGFRKASSESSHSTPSLIDVGSKPNGIANGYMTDEFDDDSDEDDEFSLSGKSAKAKNQKTKTHPKFRHKNDESGVGGGSGNSRRNSRSRVSSSETKKRLYCCTFCEFQSGKIGQLHRHLAKSHNVEHITADMIKTKISNGAANGIHTSTPKPGFAKEPKQAALPTTGRPVLMTPAGPISMRNMRREPTQDELVINPASLKYGSE